MPTPYGSRGGLAFSADELRVLRGALAVAVHSSPASAPVAGEALQLAEALDEAEREGYRLRSFLLADLARYRAALPGSAAGYLELIEDALAAGCPPCPGDVAALRTLAAEQRGPAESVRRAELLQRCERLSARAPVPPGALPQPRLRVLPGGRGAPDLAEEKPGKTPGKEPGKEPPREPRREPQKPTPPPGRRPVPTPGEVFPPRRRPSTPPEEALTA